MTFLYKYKLTGCRSGIWTLIENCSSFYFLLSHKSCFYRQRAGVLL